MNYEEAVDVYVWKLNKYSVPGGNFSLINRFLGEHYEEFGATTRIVEWVERHAFESGTYFISVVYKDDTKWDTGSQGTIVEIENNPQISQPVKISLM